MLSSLHWLTRDRDVAGVTRLPGGDLELFLRQGEHTIRITGNPKRVNHLVWTWQKALAELAAQADAAGSDETPLIPPGVTTR